MGCRWTRAQKKKAADAAARRAGKVLFVDDGIDWDCKVCTESNTSSVRVIASASAAAACTSIYTDASVPVSASARLCGVYRTYKMLDAR